MRVAGPARRCVERHNAGRWVSLNLPFTCPDHIGDDDDQKHDAAGDHGILDNNPE
ncbi:MAG TPA: hypothetical protein VLG72_01680 [Nitrospirota bacterium]|nr:hypothetical protein [Nitrospirota bacterium]